jgi:hypothetical protein
MLTWDTDLLAMHSLLSEQFRPVDVPVSMKATKLRQPMDVFNGLYS